MSQVSPHTTRDLLVCPAHGSPDFEENAKAWVANHVKSALSVSSLLWPSRDNCMLPGETSLLLTHTFHKSNLRMLSPHLFNSGEMCGFGRTHSHTVGTQDMVLEP